MKLYRVLPKEQAKQIGQTLLDRDWSEGRARTKEETGTTKKNREILEHPLLDSLGRRILANPELAIDCIPLKCHKPKFSRYSVGSAYHKHTDAPWMGNTRTDLSCTLWLSDDYEGGELVIDGEPFKGEPGECLVYECGRVHEVTEVTQGERVCAVTWIQSRIRDPYKRRHVSEYRRFVEKLKGTDHYLEAGRFNSALLRMWSE